MALSLRLHGAAAALDRATLEAWLALPLAALPFLRR
jgi:hypothetical protein